VRTAVAVAPAAAAAAVSPIHEALAAESGNCCCCATGRRPPLLSLPQGLLRRRQPALQGLVALLELVVCAAKGELGAISYVGQENFALRNKPPRGQVASLRVILAAVCQTCPTTSSCMIRTQRRYAPLGRLCAFRSLGCCKLQCCKFRLVLGGGSGELGGTAGLQLSELLADLHGLAGRLRLASGSPPEAQPQRPLRLST
jgi:hypothetical protein